MQMFKVRLRFDSKFRIYATVERPAQYSETSRRSKDVPKIGFCRLFEDPIRHSKKKNGFPNLQKPIKMAESIDPGAPKADFVTRNSYFWHPFLHRCSKLFKKWRRREISKGYNAKRGFEPSQSINSRIDFSFQVYVFQKLTWNLFLEGPCVNRGSKIWFWNHFKRSVLAKKAPRKYW